MKLCNARGDLNLADILTKHMPSQEKLNEMVTLFGCAFVDGRAKSAPLLHKRRQDELAGKGFADEDIIEAEGIDEDGSVCICLRQESTMLNVGRIFIPQMSSK